MSYFRTSYYEETCQPTTTSDDASNYGLYTSSSMIVAAGPIGSQGNTDSLIEVPHHHQQDFSFKMSPSSSTTTASSTTFSEAGPYNFKEQSASPTSSSSDECNYELIFIKTVPSKMAHRKFREPLRLRRNQKEMLYVRVPSCEERTKTVLVEMEILRQELDRKQSLKEKELHATLFPKNIRVVPVARNVKELKLQ